nr:GNAT family N-acetyltransferase [Chitinophagales bacterium]
MTGQEAYRKLLWDEAPLFHQPFWLDAVAPNQWNVAMIRREGLLHAYYLYALRKSILGTHCYMPELTQFLGPAYRVQGLIERERLNHETLVLEELCSMLPPAAAFSSRWQTGYFNWLPFYWMNYNQRVRYTYVLEDISKPETVFSQFNDKIVREIRKAEKGFSVSETEDVSQFYNLIKSNFKQKNASVQLSFEILNNVFLASQKNGSGTIWCALDGQNHWAAAIFIAWDNKTAYYIIGARDDAFGNSGAMSLLFWHAFNSLKDKVKSFDFEGSMIKGVENYFRSFGASQRMFFEITAVRSPY